MGNLYSANIKMGKVSLGALHYIPGMALQSSYQLKTKFPVIIYCFGDINVTARSKHNL